MPEYRFEEPQNAVNVRATLRGIGEREVRMRLYFESPSDDDPGRNLSSEFEGHFEQGSDGFRFVYQSPNAGTLTLKHIDNVIADMHPINHEGEPSHEGDKDFDYACIIIEPME